MNLQYLFKKLRKPLPLELLCPHTSDVCSELMGTPGDANVLGADDTDICWNLCEFRQDFPYWDWFDAIT